MALDVTVNIKLAEVVGKAGKWFPCLYLVDGTLSADTYDEYSKLSELVDETTGKKVYNVSSPVYKAAEKLFMQENAPSKIAVLAQTKFATETIAKHMTKGFRQFVLVGEHTDAAAIATYIETTDKMLFIGMNEDAKLSTLYNTVKSFDRTFIVYHKTDKNAVSAVVGATAGLNCGSFTYKNLKIKNVEPMELSAAEVENIHAIGAITIIEKVGDVVTSDGFVASGEFADLVDSKDYIIQNISYNTQKVFNINNKVPYTNQGISMLETATVEALVDAYNNGMIADKEDGTPSYSTTFALRSQTTPTDRKERNYPYGTFAFDLAGAIHKCTINGTVSV